MKVLGINSVFHEASAALVCDGTVISAAEEERFNRRKHGTEARVDTADELPVSAISYCLREAGIDPKDLDAVAYSFDPKLRARTVRLDPFAVPGDWGSEEGERIFMASLGAVPGAVSDLLGVPLGKKFCWVPHHLAHAASAYYPSPFEEAAILVVDGIGESATTLFGYGIGAGIETAGILSFPNSLGFLWEKFSRLLGFSEYDACKVMGLAGYGGPLVYRSALARIARCANGGFTIDDQVTQFRCPSLQGLHSHFNASSSDSRFGEDLAAALQELTTAVIRGLAESLYAKRPTEAICLAGGVALNCVANWDLKESGPYREVFIPCAAHDGGTAVGAALYTDYQLMNDVACGEKPTTSHHSPYLGPSYEDQDIKSVLARRRLPSRRVAAPEKEAAHLLAEGKIVAWFQGRMELGPRALGNRSLLADPRDPHVRDKLNRKIKHREAFRPFAPSAAADRAAEWFDLGRQSQSYQYMLFACPVRDQAHSQLPAIVHVDGTSRLQLVSEALNPLFHALLVAFGEIAGPPILLNTSFNDSEPIVCSPADAVNTFESTGIDVLVLGNHLVERPEGPEAWVEAQGQ
jgi:carbamoyltransferase